MPNSAELSASLAKLDAQGLKRRRRILQSPQGARVQVDGRPMLSFASNDYLGLANHPDIAAAAQTAIATSGLGSGASHLLTGHHALHDTLERELAAFAKRPAALTFSTGYMANIGIITALLGRGDALFADRLNHASLVDAAVLSRAEHVRYPHGDLDFLERKLAESPAKTKLIASDAVFSMDGDLAPVADLLALAQRHNAWLLLDDAHGFGVLGDTGGGILEHLGVPTDSDALIYMATLGKAAGVSGAFVAGSRDLIDWLINTARTYIYTTAMPPMLAAATSASLKLIAQEGERRARLAAHIRQLRAGMHGLPWTLMPSDTPIQPLQVGSNDAALRLMDGLLARGIYAPAIRPPTVPKDTARLRISLSAAHTPENIDALLGALRELAR